MQVVDEKTRRTLVSCCKAETASFRTLFSAVRLPTRPVRSSKVLLVCHDSLAYLLSSLLARALSSCGHAYVLSSCGSSVRNLNYECWFVWARVRMLFVSACTTCMFSHHFSNGHPPCRASMAYQCSLTHSQS